METSQQAFSMRLQNNLSQQMLLSFVILNKVLKIVDFMSNLPLKDMLLASLNLNMMPKPTLQQLQKLT